MTALPEIPFADADDETLALYRKLMTATGSGSPALIFRHLATHPGLLAWLWRAVGPDLEAGWPQQAVWRIVAEQPIVPLAPFSPADLDAAGIDAGARRLIDDMLTSYNRMNPMNMLAIGAARMLLGGDAEPVPAGTFAEDPAPPPAPPPDLPPPLAMAGLDPALGAAIAAICRTIPPMDTDVTPTMYRHFAHWPAFMAAVAERLDAALGDIDAATHALAAASAPLVAALAAKARARVDAAPPLADPAPVLRVMAGFGYVIPHMVVVGTAVDAALPA